MTICQKLITIFILDFLTKQKQTEIRQVKLSYLIIFFRMTKNFIFLGIILFLFSCDDPLKLGLQLEDQNKLLKTSVLDTATIICSTEMLEKVETRYASNLLAGQIQDSRFGNLTAESYFKLSYSSLDDTVNFYDKDGRKAIYDSVRFLLRIKNQTDIYGDTTQSYTLNVHELAESMDTSKVYTNSDRLKIGKLLSRTKLDPYFKGERFFRVRLDNQFGKDLFNKAQGKKQADLDKIFNGFRISAESNAVIGFDNDGNTNAVSRMELFFHYDTTAFFRSFYFLGNQTSRWYNYVQTDLQSSQVLQKLSPQNPLPSSQTNQKTFIQAGTGIVTKLTFPFLKELAKNQKVMINHAVLSFEVADETYPNVNQNPSESLIFYYVGNDGKIARDSKGGLRPIRVENSTGSGSDVAYLTSGRTYQPTVLTGFVQNVINGKENPSLIIQSGKFASSVSKVSLQDSSPNNPKKMKLIVYYTTFK